MFKFFIKLITLKKSHIKLSFFNSCMYGNPLQSFFQAKGQLMSHSKAFSHSSILAMLGDDDDVFTWHSQPRDSVLLEGMILVAFISVLQVLNFPNPGGNFYYISKCFIYYCK